jgi:hypothetical protein
MEKAINFCKNNVLEILFLLGAIAICIAYCFGFTGFTENWKKMLCGAGAFGVEALWIILLGVYAGTVSRAVGLQFLNFGVIIVMIIISAILCRDYSDPLLATSCAVAVGFCSFMCTCLFFVAIMQNKKLLP